MKTSRQIDREIRWDNFKDFMEKVIVLFYSGLIMLFIFIATLPLYWWGRGNDVGESIDQFIEFFANLF